MTDPALPHPDPDAALRDDLASWLMAHDESGVNEDPAHYVEHFHDFLHGFRASLHSGDCTKEAHACTRCLCDAYLKRADALLRGPLATLRARAATAEAELLAVDLALEGLAETPRVERICPWIGVAADAETRATAAEAERDKLRSELAAAVIEIGALSDALSAAEYLADRYRAAFEGKRVRDLPEADAAYSTAARALGNLHLAKARAALAPTDPIPASSEEATDGR